MAPVMQWRPEKRWTKRSPATPGAVVLVVPPAEEPDGLERALRCAAQEAVPVDRLGRGVQGKRVLPGPDGAVAVPPGLDEVQLADGSARHEVAGLRVDHRARALAPHLQDPPGALLRLHELQALRGQAHHGLLAVDVLARFHGRNRDGHVPVVGSGHDDGVHVLALEDGAEVAGGEDLVAPDLLRAGEPARVDVAGGHELDPGGVQGGPGVAHPLSTRADQGETDAVARGDLLALVVALVVGEDVGGRPGDRGRGGDESQEIAPGAGIGHVVLRV